MKKIAILLVLLFSAIALSACSEDADAYSMLLEFKDLYSLDGTVYSPAVREGEEGYIGEDLTSRIYLIYGAPPENFAVLLNTHVDSGAECGVFVCEGGEEMAKVSEMCRERISLLSGEESGVIIRSGSVIFYSTLEDKERAESLWQRVLRGVNE